MVSKPNGTYKKQHIVENIRDVLDGTQTEWCSILLIGLQTLVQSNTLFWVSLLFDTHF